MARDAVDTDIAKERGRRSALLPDRPAIAVAICTYKRNEALTNLLEALLVSVERLAGRAEVGVVIVDDTAEGNARPVAEKFAGRFDLGVAYRVSGRKNISLARNLAIETAVEIGDWVAMIDDDCEPGPNWLSAMLDVQRRTGAGAVTGTMIRRMPPGSPKWLTDEPFLDMGQSRPEDGASVPLAATFNSMVSSRWLKDHPHIRFQPNLGVIGGEDMVFFGTARAAGLQINYSQEGFVYENQPPSRATFSYQLRSHFWHGNSSYVTSVRNGMHPFRMFLHGVSSLFGSLVRPVVRLSHGQRPQLRYWLASMLHSLGKIVGIFGVKVNHPL